MARGEVNFICSEPNCRASSPELRARRPEGNCQHCCCKCLNFQVWQSLASLQGNITWVQRLSDNKFSKSCSVSDRLSPLKKKSQKSVVSENLGSKKSYIFYDIPSLLITGNKWKIWAKHLNARKRLLSQQVVKLSQQVNGRNSSSMQTVQVDRMGMLSSGKWLW